MCDIKNCETFLPYDQINNNKLKKLPEMLTIVMLP